MLKRGGNRAARDRILACVGTSGIPLMGEQLQRQLERPAKAAGRSSRFKAQGLRSGASPKKWADLKTLLNGTGVESRNPPVRVSCAGGFR